MSQPLAGTRVLELATDIAGPFAGKLLADFGADVIKVEPPGGDPSRRHGPFPGDVVDLEQGALHLHLNANKRSLVADLDDPTDRDLIADLAAVSDIVIESTAPGTLPALGLGYDVLRCRNPALVLTSVTPFGQDGPYADHLGADIVTYAMGGPMHATGIDTRSPLKLGGNVVSCQCGNLAATATLAALTMAERSGQGVHIDLSQFEAQAGSVDRRVTYLLSYTWTDTLATRQPEGAVRLLPTGFFPTLDGHALVHTILPWVGRMLDVLDDDGLRERFARTGWLEDDELYDLVQAALIPWLFSGDKIDRANTAQAHKWAVTPLNPPVDLLHDDHFAARDYFVEADHPVAGRYRQAGAPFRLGDSWRHRRPAPTLDQHGADIRAEHAADSTSTGPIERVADAPGASGGATGPGTAQAGGGTNRLPLEGIRVLDLTVVWAGPSCTMHLGDLGAEIIRIDNPWVFPPATRGTVPRPTPQFARATGPLSSYPDLDTSGRPWNKHSMWSAHARNKLSCTLDLRTGLGRETLLRLVERSDVIVENNSVATLDKLGVGWSVLHARNPRLIALRMPPMGLAGPYANYVGFGASFEALCGLTRIRGYRDDDPTTTTAAFHMDPASGATGAFAVLCALRRRERRGVGELIELAQSENMMHHIGEYFIDADRTGRHHGPAGNRHLTYAPQGCYPCRADDRSDDRWVVLSVADEQQWAGLCQAMDRPELLSDPRYATAADRRHHHDELDELLTAWTRGLDRWEAADRCQANGVPAGPVLDEADAFDDPHLRSRGFFRPQGSDDIGTYDFPGHQWRWTGPDLCWGPIGRLGAENDYVFTEVLGLTPVEYQELADGGHLSLDYLQPDGTPY